MQESTEIKALISLLDDPDQVVFMEVSNKIVSLGPEVIPNLEQAWQQVHDPLLQERVENLIHKIQFSTTSVQLEKWYSEGAKDLLQGAIILNKYFYPDAEVSSLLTPLQKLRTQIWLELHHYLTPLETINCMNHIVFTKFDYKGDSKYAEQIESNLLIHTLNNKKGSPIALSLLYLIVAQQLNLPIFGVNLFKHFVVCYCTENIQNFDEPNTNKILFYINPFNRGEVFGSKDIDNYLSKIDALPNKENYAPCSTCEVLKTCIEMLILAYEKENKTAEAEELMQLKNILQ